MVKTQFALNIALVVVLWSLNCRAEKHSKSPSSEIEANAQKTVSMVAGAQSPGHILFESFPQDRRKMFFEALLEDSLISGFDHLQKNYKEIAHMEAWEGNSPQLQAQILGVVLRFQSPVNHDKPQMPRNWFDITLEFSRRHISIRHNQPRNPKEVPGWKVPLGLDEQHKFFIYGKGDSSMAVLAPQINLTGQYVRALLLCPRVPHRFRQEGETVLVDSGYQLSRALFSVNASVKASTVSGGGVGLAKGSILTSPNIPRAQEFEDQTYSKDPKIELFYTPHVKEQLPPIDQKSARDLTAGVQAQVQLQRPSGHKRISTAREVLWIKEFFLDKKQAWFLQRGGQETKEAPGNCYIFYKERSLVHDFSVEPLILPERLRAD